MRMNIIIDGQNGTIGRLDVQMAICGGFYRVYASDIHYHLRVLPEGEVTTGRRTRGKRLVFIFHSHHHHVHRLLIFQMSDFQ